MLHGVRPRGRVVGQVGRGRHLRQVTGTDRPKSSDSAPGDVENSAMWPAAASSRRGSCRACRARPRAAWRAAWCRARCRAARPSSSAVVVSGDGQQQRLQRRAVRLVEVRRRCRSPRCGAATTPSTCRRAVRSAAAAGAKPCGRSWISERVSSAMSWPAGSAAPSHSRSVRGGSWIAVSRGGRRSSARRRAAADAGGARPAHLRHAGQHLARRDRCGVAATRVVASIASRVASLAGSSAAFGAVSAAARGSRRRGIAAAAISFRRPAAAVSAASWLAVSSAAARSRSVASAVADALALRVRRVVVAGREREGTPASAARRSTARSASTARRRRRAPAPVTAVPGPRPACRRSPASRRRASLSSATSMPDGWSPRQRLRSGERIPAVHRPRAGDHLVHEVEHGERFAHRRDRGGGRPVSAKAIVHRRVARGAGRGERHRVNTSLELLRARGVAHAARHVHQVERLQREIGQPHGGVRRRARSVSVTLQANFAGIADERPIQALSGGSSRARGVIAIGAHGLAATAGIELDRQPLGEAQIGAPRRARHLDLGRRDGGRERLHDRGRRGRSCRAPADRRLSAVSTSLSASSESRAGRGSPELVAPWASRAAGRPGTRRERVGRGDDASPLTTQKSGHDCRGLAGMAGLAGCGSA